MIVQFYCDNTLIATLQGNREETGAILREAVQKLGLSIDDDFELQNRLTVIFQQQGHRDLVYQTNRFRFRLHVPEQATKAA